MKSSSRPGFLTSFWDFFTRPNSLSAAVLWVLDLMNVAAAVKITGLKAFLSGTAGDNQGLKDSPAVAVPIF
jgi:hypothetical protein